MQVLPNFVDMAKTADELGLNDKPSDVQEVAKPAYPCGLSICFTQDELGKLDMDTDVKVGDMVHLFCLAKVTAVSSNDTTDGPKQRVECQITNIAVHDEDDENEEAEAPLKKSSAKEFQKKAYGYGE